MLFINVDPHDFTDPAFTERGVKDPERVVIEITERTATPPDLAMLEELCDLLRNTSLCGLGQSAPNPVMSTLRYFADEYKAHVEEKRCPAGVCGNQAEEAS